MKDQTYEEFLAARKRAIGGSDIASVLNAGRYGCQRKLFYDKKSKPRDFDDSDRMEFRRGRRLEAAAADFYVEKTGRELHPLKTVRVPGKPFLAANLDRAIAAKDRKDLGALEIKVVGRFSFLKIKKEGLIDDYSLQLCYNMAVSDMKWGAFCVYCPDLDELIHWDVEYDSALGEVLLDKAEDFFSFNIECNMEPSPLPEGSLACLSCPWSISCRGSVPVPANVGVVERPDLEPLVARLAEVKGMNSEVEQAEESLRAEILEKIKEQPGTYRAGKYEFAFKVAEQKRFSSEDFKRSNPELYEKFRKSSVTKTLTRPKER